MWPPLDTSHCRYRLNSIEKTRLSVNIPNLQYNDAIRLSIMIIDSVKATTAVGKVGAWDWMDRVGTRVHCASLGRKTTRSSSLSSGMVQPPKYPGGTPYNGLCGEAPPERGTFFRL